MEISNVHPLSARTSKPNLERSDESCRAREAVGDALAILDAIGQAGLFDAMPEEDAAQARFRTGMTLLHLMERRLRDAIGNPG